MQLVVSPRLSACWAAPNSVIRLLALRDSCSFANRGRASGGAEHVVGRLNNRRDQCAGTQGRPDPSGRVQPVRSVAIGVALSMSGCDARVVPQTFAGRRHAAVHDPSFTLFFYSMWLKARDTANIVTVGLGAVPACDRLDYRQPAALCRGMADVRADLHVDTAALLGLALFYAQ